MLKLIAIIKKIEEKKVMIHATAALQNLTYQSTDCCNAIVKNGGLKALKKLTQSKIEDVTNFAKGTLANINLYKEEAKEQKLETKIAKQDALLKAKQAKHDAQAKVRQERQEAQAKAKQDRLEAQMKAKQIKQDMQLAKKKQVIKRGPAASRAAAVQIQKIWRAHHARKNLQHRRRVLGARGSRDSFMGGANSIIAAARRQVETEAIKSEGKYSLNRKNSPSREWDSKRFPSSSVISPHCSSGGGSTTSPLSGLSPLALFGGGSATSPLSGLSPIASSGGCSATSPLSGLSPLAGSGGGSATSPLSGLSPLAGSVMSTLGGKASVSSSSSVLSPATTKNIPLSDSLSSPSRVTSSTFPSMGKPSRSSLSSLEGIPSTSSLGSRGLLPKEHPIVSRPFGAHESAFDEMFPSGPRIGTSHQLSPHSLLGGREILPTSSAGNAPKEPMGSRLTPHMPEKLSPSRSNIGPLAPLAPLKGVVRG